MFAPLSAARWSSWCQAFAARPRREKMVVAAAAALSVVYSVYWLWIEPGLEENRKLRTELISQAQEQKTLRELLAAGMPDPDAANRRRLSEIEQRLREQELALQHVEAKLLPPHQAVRFLEEILGNAPGVQLLGIRTLPAYPIVRADGDGAEESGGKGAAAAGRKEEVETSNLYRHGIEVKIAGNYLDLLRYLARLEGQKNFFWGDVRLAVEHYPDSILTVKLYTLSLESTWLAL